MAKKVEKKEEKKPLTRAKKTEATKDIVREILQVKPTKHNELIEEVAKVYALRHAEEGETENDVKGRVGSVLDIMKKNSDVMFDGGMYALKARMMMPPPPQKAEKTEEPVKKTAKPRAKKAESKAEEKVEKESVPAEVTPAPKKRTRAKKAAENQGEQPPVEVKEEKAETPAPKKRGRKPKAEVGNTEKVEKAEGTPTPAPVAEVAKAQEALLPVVKEAPLPTPVAETVTEKPVAEEKKEEKALVVQPKAEIATKEVMDMSFLFGDKATKSAPKKEEPKKEEPKKAEPDKKENKAETPKKEEKKVAPVERREAFSAPAQKKEEKKTTPTPAPVAEKKGARGRSAAKTPVALTADEKLKESFLKKMRALGGDYFEYYSTYLLERYSIKNGRRLESLRISGGDHDGGIDGEIELTDALGFKETIYIQSKNWDPEKGKEDKWVVGETLLQQFIGACACRQAKDGKLHARGIFITTSRFTPEAKRILEDMADKIVGYDGNDLYEAAKECSFGLVKKNGEWTLDENLLSGPKAFFQMW